ncbi:MAG: calcium-binding protein, partial [Pseudomonadota bacterium]
GNDGNDTIEGGGGDDVLIGGADADRLLGQSGADRLIGEGGGDTLRGGSGADTLIGDDGADFLAGDTGADTLRPGTGEDTLNGGSGADYLDAAADSMRDIFQFGTGFGNDVIAAFEAGIDKLDFRQNAQVSGFGDLRLIEKGADMVVRIVGVPDDFVTVRNAAATLGEADIFV